MTDQDDSQNTGAFPRSVNDIVAQLRGLTEKLTGMTGLSALTDSFPGMRGLPRPAALSASQLQAVASTVAAQRRSVEALQAQLQAFNEQLTVLEGILDPLTAWTAALASFEKTVMDLGTPPSS